MTGWPRHAVRPAGAVTVLAAALSLGPAAVAAGLDAGQERGKQIYFEGTSARGGTITAVVGDEGVTLPASAVPCASCHGPDGLGRPEGGVVPPDIRWRELTKSYGHVHEDGRRHPPFTEVNLARLLRSGLDPAHNRIDRSMPLYQMSEKDMDDLVAYLKHLELDRDPGVGEERVQLGTLLPLQGPQGELGRAMAQAMHAHFEEVNARGGVYGRRIELLAVPYGATPQATLGNLEAALEQEAIFAMVGAYTVGLDAPILELLRARDVPLIGPFTLDPGDALVDEATFYLFSGFDEQVRALADQAVAEADADGQAPMLIVAPEGERLDRLVAAVQDQLRAQGVIEPAILRYARGELDTGAVAARMTPGGEGALFFFGRQPELDPLLEALADAGRKPRVYLLSSYVTRPPFAAPEGFHHRIFIAYPTLSTDISAKGRAEYQALAERHALPPDHIQGQIAALAAAKLLVEGLRRGGRDLSRISLVEGLEALYAYNTGLTPPLTYGPNRRIGARGAHVITVDLMKKAYQPVGGWHELR